MNERKQILLADQEEIFVKTLTELLQREGYMCAWAPDAATVESSLAHASYDVLIAELMMPGNQHLELIHEVARLAPGLPVIITASYPSLESAIQSIQLPVVSYLIKPFRIETLLADIGRAVARAQSYRTIQEVQQKWRALGQMFEQFTSEVRRLIPEPTVTTEARPGLPAASLEAYMTGLPRCPTPAPPEAPYPAVPFLPETVELDEAGLHNTSLGGKTFPPELLVALRRLSRREREVLRLLLANHRPQAIARHLFISPYTVRNHRQAIFTKLAVHSQTELLTRLGPYLWSKS